MPFELVSLRNRPNSFNSIQLIATDMDGTLTQRGRFTAPLLIALEQLRAAQIPVIIVTGRSAGWVQGIVSYLPVAGAIAENGGLFYPNADSAPDWLVNLPEIPVHRQKLAAMFHQLQQDFPQIRESNDNRFRLTDWTFDVQGLTVAELRQMGDRCHAQGWGFTYSTVQCHIRPLEQDKAVGLEQVMQRYFGAIALDQIMTVGDSPNDESLLDAFRFPNAVGVGNLRHYADQLQRLPRYITQSEEVEGFVELANLLLNRPKI